MKKILRVEKRRIKDIRRTLLAKCPVCKESVKTKTKPYYRFDCHMGRGKNTACSPRTQERCNEFLRVRSKWLSVLVKWLMQIEMEQEMK